MRPLVAIASSAAVLGAGPGGLERRTTGPDSADMPAGTDEDQPVLDAALRALGLDVAVWAWDDAGAAWDEADLVVIRSTWDYAPRRAEFCRWAEEVGRRTPLHNPPEVVRWNTDKHYLAELAAAGVPVTPTVWLEPGDDVRLPEAEEVVVKPAISAGARDTTRHRRGGGDQAAVDAAADLLAEGRSVMVQPYLGAVDTEGETGLVFVDGAFQHAFRKHALLAPDAGATDELFAPERIEAVTAGPREREVAASVLEAMPFAAGSMLYARVDLAPGPTGEPVLMELELVEPALFFAECEAPADGLAGAVEARLRAAPAPRSS